MSDSILEKADRVIEEYFDVDVKECEPDLFGRICQQANNAMKIRHDAMIKERFDIDQRLRVMSMVITDVKMREEYTRVTMPKLLPPDLKLKKVNKHGAQ